MTHFEAKKGDDVLTSEVVAAAEWKKILARTVLKPFIHFDNEAGFFWLRLEPFEAEAADEVTFEMRDVVNRNWKSGMDWDFIQLKRLS